MKLRTFLAILTAIATLTITTEIKAQQNDVKFICAESYDQESNKRVPTTFAWTPESKIAIVRWKKETFNDIGYTPQQRCEVVSPKLDAAYQENGLRFITHGVINNQKVICSASSIHSIGNRCDTVLWTLGSQDDPLKVLWQLNEVLAGRASIPITQSSSTKLPDYYEVDMEEFLRTAPDEGE